MKIVKRDGRIVEYNPDKIRIAITKANAEVDEKNKASKREIEAIIKYIESLKKKRMLVEDIQDIIEEKLMRYGKYQLAKSYIIYRYTRALVRKSNTTDETVLSILKNSNDNFIDNRKSCKLISEQREQIACEVSKDLAIKMLLPYKIAKAHEEGAIYFHDTEYSLQPTICDSIINVEDMLEKGTEINGIKIETPRGFQAACNVTMQIIVDIASSQSGGIAVDTAYLGKYLNKSYIKNKTYIQSICNNSLSEEEIDKLAKDKTNRELSSGIQTIYYQTNTLIAANGKAPNITFVLNLIEDEYVDENKKIIQEFLNQNITGLKDSQDKYITSQNPKLIYVLNDINVVGKKYYGLTKLSLECTKKNSYPEYVSSFISKKNNEKDSIVYPVGDSVFLYKSNKKEERVFSLGKVTLNLPRIGILANSGDTSFESLLEENLDTCFEALMYKYHTLSGTNAEVSPIHWVYGGITRIDEKEKIDSLIRQNGILCLGFVGLEELVYSLNQDNDFKVSLIKKLQDRCKKWSEDTGLKFELNAQEEDSVCKYMLEKDKENYGNVKKITDKDKYSNAFHEKNKIVTEEELENEIKYTKMCKGGFKITINKNITDNDIDEFVTKIYENIEYVQVLQNEQ